MDNRNDALPVTLDLGADHPGSGDDHADALGRIQVAWVAESGPQAAEELRLLLRKRLRFVGALMSVVGLCYVAPNTYLWARHPDAVGRWMPWILSLYLFWTVTLLVSAVLWSRFPLSVRRLRICEIILFGTLTALQFFTLIWLSVGNGILAEELANPKSSFAATIAMVWFALVVGYGVLIPNTGRRCALVVAVLAGLPMGGFFLSGAALPEIWERHRANLIVGTMYIATWMGVGVALAIYGAQRIETLRREATAGRQLGQYRLRQRLGSGGMGEVFLAEHVMLRRPCAIKLIRPERTGDLKNLLRFEREVQTTATLTHPNTVQIFDYGHAADGTFYYVMEYLPGLNLEELVRRDGPLPASRVIHFLKQICGALKEAHGRGLIHRDIKPGNVMVCERGGIRDVAKLLDFGLVLLAVTETDGEKLTQDGTVTGTPAYLSPEQAGGQETVDARSDIYSLGALAYYLLTGHPPFANRSGVKMLAAHIYEVPAPLSARQPDVPADLEAVVLRCLAKEPSGRFPDAASLEEALSFCCAASPWTERDASPDGTAMPTKIHQSRSDDPDGRTKSCT